MMCDADDNANDAGQSYPYMHPAIDAGGTKTKLIK